MKKYGPSFLKFVVYFIYSFFSFRPFLSASNFENLHCLDTLKFGFFENVSSTDFHSVVSKLTDKPFLRKRSLNEYQKIIEDGGHLFLISNKSAGYGIKHDGLLISVFKTEETKGLGSLVVKSALLNGATSLICADGPLKDFYEGHGFEVTSRFPMTPENAGYSLKWKDDIRPDMLFMELKSFKKSKSL